MAESLKTSRVTIREGADIVGVSVQRMHQLIETYELETEYLNPRMKTMKRCDANRLAEMERPAGVHVRRKKKPV